jgi:cadmium resistance protein CadD (predicted permease)
VAHLASVVVTAIGAFMGTNIDDFVVLLLLILGMPLDKIRRWQIVTGQYLGFCALLVISACGALALRTVSENWVGLLGVVPLALGIRGFIQAAHSSDATSKTPIIASNITKVAIVTVANGGDNISVYVLLFRQLNMNDIAVTILVFLVSLGGLCMAALVIGQNVQIIPGIVRSNKWLTPTVFVTIGAFVLVRTGTVAHLLKLA